MIGLHKGTHTLTEPNVYIKEAWRIGLRLNYCLMLREAFVFGMKEEGYGNGDKEGEFD